MASLHFVPFEKEMIEFIVVCSAMQPVKKSAAAGASCRRHTVADFLYIMYVLFTIDTPAPRGVSRDQLNWSLAILTKLFQLWLIIILLPFVFL